MRHIGIFAGSFDPIHSGHLAFARSATKAHLSKVYFLPEPRPRYKQGVKALEHRQAMIRLAIKNEPKMGLIVLEQARFDVAKTLPVLMSRFNADKIYMLFGADAIKHINKWPLVENLAAQVRLIIAVRTQDKKLVELQFKSYLKISGLKFDYQFIDVESPELSSSKIRADFKKHSQALGLNPQVQAYITKHRLYASSASGSS